MESIVGVVGSGAAVTNSQQKMAGRAAGTWHGMRQWPTVTGIVCADT